MAGDQSVSVKDAVYKLQMSLLEGIQNEDQLFAAGSLMSRSDYEDVVVERSIANLCGYPLCGNPLPSERPHKGRYRISLKEHKVYDLQETYMFCSSSCVVNSRAFAGSLQDERCSTLNPAKINGILRLFEGLSVDSDELGKNGDLGMSKLKIKEKAEIETAEVALEQWIGPSNAIEGYVPQKERDSKIPPLNNSKEGSKTVCTEHNSKQDSFFSDMDFVSAIITEDEYTISKTPSSSSSAEVKGQKGKGTRMKSKVQSYAPTNGEMSSQGLPSPSNSCQTSSDACISKSQDEYQGFKTAKLGESTLKSSLKSLDSKRYNRSVTWADEKVDSSGSRNLCEVREMENGKEGHETSDNKDIDDGNILRFESAEACAIALRQAAEAVASGSTDASIAVSEAGVIILPPSQDSDRGDSMEDIDTVGQESTALKWPNKPGIPKSEFFDPEDSFYDDPPEGFDLTLSPFATMWMALFAWVTSSSLAYIYGRDESSHEDYLLVNGREYPQKTVLRDGRSSEIKQTVEGCLARAFPGLVAELRLPIPISTLEQGVVRLLDTMSFVDALPAFRMKQWQVIALLFIESLSVCRIHALTPHMTNRRTMLHKVLDGARISAEEFETMKDLLIPLGRAPHFSAQSGA